MSLPQVRLADLATVTSGGGAPQDADAFSKEGIPFVRAGSLVKLLDGQPEESLELLQPEVASGYKLKLFPAGTVLFAKSGMSATKGHIYQLRNPAYVVNHLAALIPNSREDGDYLSQVLRFKSPTSLIQDAAYPSIRLGDIEEMEIPAPSSRDERKRIAAILDQADDLGRKRQRVIARLDELGQAIFQEMFGDPVTNPNGFPIKKFGDIGLLDRGISKHRPRNDPALLGGNHPLIQTGDVANADGYIRSFSSTYSDLGLKQSRKWPKGTLCITIAANIGKTAILEIDACFPDSVVGFTPRSGTNAEYVRFWMERIQKRLEEVAHQSAQKNINLAILRELPIPVPAQSLQDDFRNVIHAIERQKSVFRLAERQYKQLFSSVQHRAFRGEL